MVFLGWHGHATGIAASRPACGATVPRPGDGWDLGVPAARPLPARPTPAFSVQIHLLWGERAVGVGAVRRLPHPRPGPHGGLRGHPAGPGERSFGPPAL